MALVAVLPFALRAARDLPPWTLGLAWVVAGSAGLSTVRRWVGRDR